MFPKVDFYIKDMLWRMEYTYDKAKSLKEKVEYERIYREKVWFHPCWSTEKWLEEWDVEVLANNGDLLSRKCQTEWDCVRLEAAIFLFTLKWIDG